MAGANGSLAGMVSDVEPPTLPRAAKRRRTALQRSSPRHQQTSWQDVQPTSTGHQRNVAARLADVESREVAVALREGFCERLEAELAARVALLEAQAAAAAARAVGAPPPDDMAAQATAALRILQALAADGGLPTETRRSRQHLQPQPGPAAAAAQGHRPEHRSVVRCSATRPAADLAAPPAAPSTGQRELGGGKGDTSGRGGQPAFSQHSHHSTMSHATAVGNHNDSPDSPRSHPRFLLHPPSAPPSPPPTSRGRQQPAAAARAQHATAAMPTSDNQQDGHATPGHHSCSGSPDLSAATGPSSDRFSNGSLQALPRSPFAGPMQEAALRHLYTGSTPAAFNSGLNPELLLGGGTLAPAQQHVRLAGKWGKSTADMYCGPDGSSLGTETAQQLLPAAAAPGGISRINSADDSSADAHGNAHGGIRIRLSNSAPRLDLVGRRPQQQHGLHIGGQRPASNELRNSSVVVDRRHNSADQPLVVPDARQPGLDSLANIAAADANGADLPLLPASSGVKPAAATAAAASVSVGHGQQLPAAGFTAVQPPSPSASCRSRAGSVAAEDLAFHWGQGPTLQQAQTLQQAVQAGAQGTSVASASQAPPLQPQGGAAERRQRTAAAAARAPAAGGKAAAAAAAVVSTGPHPSTQLPLAFSKTLDYKSCDHILCLTKDMARQLLPPAPHSCSSTGSSCQMQVELEDPHGRLWPMTYRSVPARYSYEFRAGWKAFAAAWGITTGDAITLARHTDNRHRLRIEIMHGEGGGGGGPSSSARAGRGGGAASRGVSSASAGGHGGGLAPAGERRNSGGSVGGVNVKLEVGSSDRNTVELPQPAAMAPLLAAVQQAAEHMAAT